MYTYLVTWVYTSHEVSADVIEEALAKAIEEYGDHRNIIAIKQL